jgi:ligand-binding SRPBCC domain-containing protein
MPVFERSVDIAAPIADVFAFHLDTRNVPLITPPSQEVTDIVGTFPLVVGAEVEMRVRQAPVPGAQPWRIRVTALEEPTLIVDELVEHPMLGRFAHEHRFEDLGAAGTRLTDRIDWEIKAGPAKAMYQAAARGVLESAFGARQDNTKALLEARAAG